MMDPDDWPSARSNKPLPDGWKRIGPIDIPGNGTGTLTYDQMVVIANHPATLGCKASIRKRGSAAYGDKENLWLLGQRPVSSNQ